MVLSEVLVAAPEEVVVNSDGAEILRHLDLLWAQQKELQQGHFYWNPVDKEEVERGLAPYFDFAAEKLCMTRKDIWFLSPGHLDQGRQWCPPTDKNAYDGIKMATISRGCPSCR